MRRNRKQSGMALATALILSTVLVLLVSLSVRYAVTSSHAVQRDRARADALNVAEGGVELAISTFDPSSLGALATTSTFAAGTYTLTASNLPNNLYAIEADAFVPSPANPLASRSIRVVVATGSNPLGNYALATDADLTLSGSAMTIDSAPVAGQGNVHSNQNLTANGHPSISGTVSASGPSNNFPEGTANAPPVEIPPFSAGQIQSFATQAQSSGLHPITDPVGSVLSGYYESYPGYDIQSTTNSNGGTLSIRGTVTVHGVVFIEGSLSMAGGTITGNGLIVCTEKFSAVGGRASIAPSNPLRPIGIISLSSLSTPIEIGGNASVQALVFAANGGVFIHGTPTVSGAVIARGQGTIAGHVTILRDTRQPIDLLQIPYWRTVSYQAW